MQRIGFLHAHHSNIRDMEQAFEGKGVVCVHMVDPCLVHRIATDDHFSNAEAAHKVEEHINWMASSQLDAIVVTCTTYAALLPVKQGTGAVPVVAVDEPFFQWIGNGPRHQRLVFTNPATVKGTMNRLQAALAQKQHPPEVECTVINHTFSLMMEGKEEAYTAAICDTLQRMLAEKPGEDIAVAQLSMANAARLVQAQTGHTIRSPLEPLVAYVLHLIGKQPL